MSLLYATTYDPVSGQVNQRPGPKWAQTLMTQISKKLRVLLTFMPYEVNKS